jgi:hypothetical protein
MCPIEKLLNSLPFVPLLVSPVPIPSVDAKLIEIEREREALHSELIEQGVRGMSTHK